VWLQEGKLVCGIILEGLIMNAFAKLAKDYLEKLNNLLEQDEDIEINSVDEIVEKFNDYGNNIS
jgi:hypothetical protein